MKCFAFRMNVNDLTWLDFAGKKKKKKQTQTSYANPSYFNESAWRISRCQGRNEKRKTFSQYHIAALGSRWKIPNKLKHTN